MRELLRRLNVWFPGEFRAIADAPLHARADTTVVKATHKVRPVLGVVANAVFNNMWFHAQAAGEVVVKAIITDDKDRYKRAKREMNLFRMFHENKRICDMINGKAVDATNGMFAMCACVLHHYEIGTVQTLLDSGNPEFSKRPNASAHPCLRFKHAVDMAKDVLAGLECMHQMRFVHRDIKPANICVEMLPGTTQLRFVIIDLGAAVSMEVLSRVPSSAGAAAASAVGFTGQQTTLAGLKLPLGTVLFMSPEHIDEDRTVDGRSDLFSLGVTMYKCMSGRFPFIQLNPLHDDKRRALKLILAYASSAEAAPVNVRTTGEHGRAAEVVCGTIAKSLRKLPAERFENASVMKEQLESVGRCRVWMGLLMCKRYTFRNMHARVAFTGM